MKKLINAPDQLLTESLDGFAAAHADRISSVDLNPVLVMPRGQRGLTYVPPRAGRYTVEVQAVDLLNHYTRVERTFAVKPRKGRRAPRA